MNTVMQACSAQIRGSASRLLPALGCSQISCLRHVLQPVGGGLNWRSSASVRSLHAGRLQASAEAAIATKPTSAVIKDATPTVGMDERHVSVSWDAHTQSRFHHIWLRDHCRCPKCFHATTKQRLFNTFEIPRTIQPVEATAGDEGLRIRWSASHDAVYPWHWLEAHSYDPTLPALQPTSEKVIWGAEMAQSPPTVLYKDVMSGDSRGLFQWLSNIDRFGIGFVSGVPATLEATEELTTRIGFIRETQYGKFWEFTSDLTKGDTAYTTLALGAHTDNTYFTDPAGLQLFHLLSHTGGSGGATLLVDGFHVASILKDAHPQAYELLSRVCVPAHAAGEADSIYMPSPSTGYPALSHDTHGALVQVRWNNDDRSVMSGLKPDEVEAWYDAIRIWNRLLTSPDAEYWVQLTPGTVIAIDNHRVMHGRSSFDGKRQMCGAYIGVDEYRSKLAVLREQFGGQGSGVGERSVWHPAL